MTPTTQQLHASALRSMLRVVHETTEPTDPSVALAAVAEQFRRGDVLVLTGAGVSTESGIPDYRGPAGSLTRGRPMTYQEFLVDHAALRRYWARSYVGWTRMAAARPNRAHYGLVEVERAGLLAGLITQNVDGLHHAAGQKRVVALHGDLATVVCLDCEAKEPRSHLGLRIAEANPGYLQAAIERAGQVNPDGDIDLPEDVVADYRMVGCRRCGSVRLKPDVVYFGEPVPRQRKDAMSAMLGAAKAVVVLGSSLAVMSGFRLVIAAQRTGIPVSVINGGPGRADERVDVLWRTNVGDAVDALLDELEL
ncbi:Sir2 family NAD-dependent protein deacetylase [Corynebacterium uterequi]|uniref:Sir2 family NAD-dependent protein deacetylase n=1 Tax=Corynebacterium uterequi TaxID=1072256 RepID=UPI0038B40A9D